MTEKTIPEEITHLDFQVSEGPKCEGATITEIRDGVRVSVADTTGCPNTPALFTIRGCCGIAAYYCLSCYNMILRYQAVWRAEGKGSVHFPVKGNYKIKHPFSDPVFSVVERS